MSAPLTCKAIADKFGLTERRVSWRGTCPVCEYGGSGTLSVKAGRNGQVLLYCASGCSQESLHTRIIGEPPKDDPKADADAAAARARKRDRALVLWNGSEPIRGTPAATYLAARGLAHLVICPDLRFRGDAPHPEGGRLPALVALIRDAAGDPLAVHRTYLRRDGSGKAAVDPPKASLGPVWSGAIRLAPIAAELVIGEGVETAAAAGVLTGLPAWAAISAGNLAQGLVLPVGVRSLVIAVDRDKAGERAARDAAQRWRAEGRHVRLLVPDQSGADAADVLAARGQHHAA